MIATLWGVEVVVTLRRDPWSLRLKVNEPRCVGWIVQDFSDTGVPENPTDQSLRKANGIEGEREAGWADHGYA